MLFTLFIVLLIAYVSWTWLCIEQNVQKAAQMGIPIIRLPIDSHNILWQIFESHFWKITDAAPIPWSSYPESIRYMRRGWHFYEKADAHVRHGPIWALVSAASINVLVSSPEANREILTRRRDFPRQIKNYKILDVFGPSISTADSDNWSRHRKAVAVPFSESAMKFVWNEAFRQAAAMSQAWSQPKVQTGGIPSVQSDTRSVSLNILAATGFGKSYDFYDSETDVEESSYRAALQTILDNAIPLMLIPYKVLMAPMVPKSWGKIGRAGDSFKRYMVQMLDEETEASKQNKPGAGGLMTSLVKALNVHEKNIDADSALARGLSVEEIFGNIFVINFAGHDTTANTLAFAMLLLARYPDIQEWVAEEVSEVGKRLGSGDWPYEPVFDELLRCRAVLYETLRVFPPVMAIPRGTDEHPQILNIQGRSIQIPAHADVTVSLLASHTDPSIWTDPLTWKPSRWVPGDKELFYQPPPYTFFPWSDGPQNCIGKKFAEVESVAVLARVLHGHRLQIKQNEGESLAAAMNRLSDTINNVNMEMLLRMKDADRVRLQYVPA